MEWYSWYTWLLTGVLCLLGEALTPGFILLWFSIAGFITAIITYFIQMVWYVQLAVYAGVLFVLGIGQRFLLKPLMGQNRRKDSESETNMNALIDKIGVVVESIDNNAGEGRVRIKGQLWSAENIDERNTIPEGEEIKVIRVIGNRLLVEKNK